MPNATRPGRPTIRDVAERANVSIASVSRVLSGVGGAATQTEAAIRAAAAELGFRANRAGRDLRAGSTRTLGVMFPTLSNPVFAECADGIEQEARALGLSVLLTTTAYQAEYERQALDNLLSHRVAGMILTVTDGDDSSVLDTLDAEGLPYVLLLNQPRRMDRCVVTVDNVQGAYAATAALIAEGHRRIGMVAGRFAQSDRSKRRYEGFCAALADAGLQPGELIELPFETTDHRAILRSVLDRPDRPTGFFCSGDLLALHVISIFAECDVRVPQDVSVIGFDGIEIGNVIRPSLTTIAQPSIELGRKAVSMLQARITAPNDAPVGRQFVSHELLMRQTLSGPST